MRIPQLNTGYFSSGNGSTEILVLCTDATDDAADMQQLSDFFAGSHMLHEIEVESFRNSLLLPVQNYTSIGSRLLQQAFIGILDLLRLHAMRHQGRDIQLARGNPLENPLLLGKL